MRTLATLAAPSGIMTAMTARMTAQGISSAQLYAMTGLSSTEWNALNAALSGANAAAFLKFANALGLFFAAHEAPYRATTDGTVAVSPGKSITSVLGDLS